jgi:hypothetical protein
VNAGSPALICTCTSTSLTSIPENATVRIRATPSAEGLSIAIVLVEPRISLNRPHLGMPGHAGKAIIYLWLIPASAAPLATPLITVRPGCSRPLAHGRAPGVPGHLGRSIAQRALGC